MDRVKELLLYILIYRFKNMSPCTFKVWDTNMQVCTGFTTGKPQPGMLHQAN